MAKFLVLVLVSFAAAYIAAVFWARVLCIRQLRAQRYVNLRSAEGRFDRAPGRQLIGAWYGDRDGATHLIVGTFPLLAPWKASFSSRAAERQP